MEGCPTSDWEETDSFCESVDSDPIVDLEITRDEIEGLKSQLDHMRIHVESLVHGQSTHEEENEDDVLESLAMGPPCIQPFFTLTAMSPDRSNTLEIRGTNLNKHSKDTTVR